MPEVLEEVLLEGAEALGIVLEREMLKLFGDYYRILMEGSRKHNLTSIRGEREVAVKHFLDSLTCAKVADIDGREVVDLGTGAGLPGIPLKIYQPGAKLLLVDSVKKKVDFVRSLIEKLGLEGIRARRDRAEAMGSSGDYRERSDVVVSRAVAPLNVLAELCLPLIRVGGCFLAMKGPAVEEEIAAGHNALILMGGELERVESIKLPVVAEERKIVLVRKRAPTPPGYPRRDGMPAKRPIV